MAGALIRRRFLEYFVSKSHTEVRSSPLAPQNDPTLLFTNAGMVQFKNVFTGAEQRPYKRAASSQKCLRVSGKHNDLESVGRTARHQTFFEMLGNFSFGDYFKEQAIEYGWEFMTQKIGLPADNLHATVFREDDDAAEIWARNIGLPANRIHRLGEKDNFWSMGDTGPCGPCSEIHIDRGPAVGCGRPDCSVECECDRFIELWNLVFMQFDRDADGKLNPLPKPSVDTGMGLERLAAVIQGKSTNFDTDLIFPIIEAMGKMTDVKYGSAPETDVSFRVIGDHVRALAFLVADGINPSNEGRGYVLRRIARRALRHGRMLGVNEPFAHKLAPVVVEMMKESYPELAEAQKAIIGVTLAEEKSFASTLEFGMKMIDGMVGETKAKGAAAISGADLFRLYDTYGFPLDLARDVITDAGLGLDMDGYNALMEEAQEKARKSWKGGAAAKTSPLYAAGEPTLFLGYDAEETNGAAVISIIKEGAATDRAAEGDEVEIILDKTPFYAESGGQASDLGVMENESAHLRVLSVTKPNGTHWAHKVKIAQGAIARGEIVNCKVDHDRRADIRRNHSATHLLHAALRQTLGAHVKQAGSLVAPERLRFDYTHFTAPDKAELDLIESMVNRNIMANAPVRTEIKSVEEAVKSGAMALFGEKYGEAVRVVAMGEFSTELCGGTHASATGDIGLFKIVSEGGVAAGVRRIEGVTGVGALEHLRKRDEELEKIGAILKAGGDLPAMVQKQIDRAKELEKENRKLKEKLASGGGGGETELVEIEAGGVKARLVATEVEGADAQTLRAFVDNQKNKLKTGAIIVAMAREGEKALIAVGVTEDLTKKIQAGKIIKEVAAIVGGGGGGRPDFAQAGGKNPEKLDEALRATPDILRKLLGG
ncbi:MAG: alanine--tRNA ligase [Nitrospinota bacterium]|nr:alanine--tRNA ligase [Nitrospinota bacterium]